MICAHGNVPTKFNKIRHIFQGVFMGKNLSFHVIHEISTNYEEFHGIFFLLAQTLKLGIVKTYVT